MDLPDFQAKVAELEAEANTLGLSLEFYVKDVGFVNFVKVQLLTYNDSGNKSHVALVCLTRDPFYPGVNNGHQGKEEQEAPSTQDLAGLRPGLEAREADRDPEDPDQ